MPQVKRCRRFILMMLIAGVLLAGCQKKGADQGERKDVTFTVVEQRKLPTELLQIIEENKEEEIRLTFEDGEDLYLVRGYGEQKTGGYSITVTECSEDEETVRMKTQLIGPADQRNLSEDPSYPWIAIKVETREKEAVIE